ncbi:MAG: hypothetical protein C4576_20400 [Desulfobacteraceae bacterium]|nr:MAG: hypothetical protein C4576_20400 [Desulfobacteraceae bacterium]
MSDIIEDKLEAILKNKDPMFKYRDDLNLRSDMNLDSLDVMEFLFEIESQMSIKIAEEDIDKCGLLVLGNLRQYISKRLGPAA